MADRRCTVVDLDTRNASRSQVQAAKLAHGRRQSVLELLDETPQSVREISLGAGIPKSAVGRHLQRLVQDGAVRRVNEGFVVETGEPRECDSCGRPLDAFAGWLLTCECSPVAGLLLARAA